MSILQMIALIFALFTAQEDRCFDKGGVWDAEAERCLIRSSFELEIAYPTELADYDIVTETLDAFVADQKEQFAQMLSFGVESLPASYAPWTLSMDYATYAYSDTIMTVVYTISQYAGGAHPNTYYQTFTFDLAENRLLTLEDLFTEAPYAVLTPLVAQNLMEQMGEWADVAWIENGTGDNPENYRNFALTEDELIFFIPPYQVAAYAAGSFEVRIPLSELSDILVPELDR
jgi:hypothetical protein